MQDVDSGISECQRRLERLGIPCSTIEEQRRYLLRVSQTFSALMKAALDGIYNDCLLGSAKTEEGYRKRLRAIVQDSLTDFQEEMRSKGQARFIVESEPNSSDGTLSEISRSDYINEVKELMRRSQGRELPGTINPLVIGELFTKQCQP